MKKKKNREGGESTCWEAGKLRLPRAFAPLSAFCDAVLSFPSPPPPSCERPGVLTRPSLSSVCKRLQSLQGSWGRRPPMQRRLGVVVLDRGSALSPWQIMERSSPDLQPGEGQISGAIEVEQKFLFGPSTIEKLTDLEAVLESRASFRDSYYDVPNWCLTRADHWLREREGVGWELKCPLVVGAVGSDTPCAAETDNHLSTPVLRPPRDMRSSHTASQYQEVTCPQNIVTCLCSLLDRDPGQNWSCCVNKAVEELGLQVFASFVTMRHKYRVGDLHVDLDEVDFGYSVGEVEAMVQRLEDIPEALEKIHKFCKQLGLEEKTAIPGKMSVYLQRFRPAHYKVLMGAGLVQKVINTTDGQDGKV